MFWNIYSKRILSSLRSRDTLIWTLIFPIMLATLFYFTLSSLDAAELLSRFPIGVVDTKDYREDTMFRSALESVSGENGLFELTVFPGTSDADAALENGTVEGYILADGNPRLVVSGDGLNQTIAKSFLDRYLQTKNSVMTLLLSNPSADVSAILDTVDYTSEISLSKSPVSSSVSYFYALLAMVCLYGGFQGQTTVTYLQANLSALGARRTMLPAGRFKMVVYDLLGAITVHFACLLIIVIYIIFVLGTDFGPQLGLVLLTCLVGSVLGVAFGAMVSAVSRMKEQAKTAVLVSVTMVCSFLSGLMMSGINYTVAQKAPVVAWLNPAARISDAFYCLYYYDNYERFFLNIGVIIVMALVMLAVTAIFVRRQRYESI